MACLAHPLSRLSHQTISTSIRISRPTYSRLFHTAQGQWSIKTAIQSTIPGAGKPRVAVLFQAIDPPVINGIRKPRKPGGYQDSGADIAYVLQSQPDVNVLTPSQSPGPSSDIGWCFPDNEDGILLAIQKGATHLWANTILFGSHPLQCSSRLDEHQTKVRVVGQPPLFVEKFDDKDYTNNLLRARGLFPMPRSWTIDRATDLKSFQAEKKLPLPIVGKPIRGRGSHGVKVCYSVEELYNHVQDLLKDSPVIMLEEYLSGQEATITVMPPSKENPDYYAMPVVTRFNHHDGIAPYNGIVAVTANSRALSQEEVKGDGRYAEASRQCEDVARLLHVTAPIRIDIRRFNKDPKSQFALFDINMKPNMTGPGRPGRENQASLTAMSAAALGWDYPKLLRHILSSARTLEELRNAKPATM